MVGKVHCYRKELCKLKWSLFCKNKKEDLKQKSSKQAAAPRTVPGIKEGYFVDRFYSYGEPVDFINEKKGIRKAIIRNHSFVNFPGVDEAVEEGRKYNRHSNESYAGWMNYVEKKPIEPRFRYRVEFSRPNEQGHTKILWMLQPHDTADDDGFGMENTPEIMLSAILDENGNYMGPFKLERVSW